MNDTFITSECQVLMVFFYYFVSFCFSSFDIWFSILQQTCIIYLYFHSYVNRMHTLLSHLIPMLVHKHLITWHFNHHSKVQSFLVAYSIDQSTYHHWWIEIKAWAWPTKLINCIFDRNHDHIAPNFGLWFYFFIHYIKKKKDNTKWSDFVVKAKGMVTNRRVEEYDFSRNKTRQTLSFSFKPILSFCHRAQYIEPLKIICAPITTQTSAHENTHTFALKPAPFNFAFSAAL